MRDVHGPQSSNTLTRPRGQPQPWRDFTVPMHPSLLRTCPRHAQAMEWIPAQLKAWERRIRGLAQLLAEGRMTAHSLALRMEGAEAWRVRLQDGACGAHVLTDHGANAWGRQLSHQCCDYVLSHAHSPTPAPELPARMPRPQHDMPNPPPPPHLPAPSPHLRLPAPPHPTCPSPPQDAEYMLPAQVEAAAGKLMTLFERELPALRRIGASPITAAEVELPITFEVRGGAGRGRRERREVTYVPAANGHEASALCRQSMYGSQNGYTFGKAMMLSFGHGPLYVVWPWAIQFDCPYHAPWHWLKLQIPAPWLILLLYANQASSATPAPSCPPAAGAGRPGGRVRPGAGQPAPDQPGAGAAQPRRAAGRGAAGRTRVMCIASEDTASMPKWDEKTQENRILGRR